MSDAALADRWSLYRSWIDGLPGDAINIAHEAVGRHVMHGRGEREAIRWLGRQTDRRSLN